MLRAEYASFPFNTNDIPTNGWKVVGNNLQTIWDEDEII